MINQPYQFVEATFSPRNPTDLKKGAIRFIGRRGSFQALWLIEEGPYEGQWAMAIPRQWSDELQTASWEEAFAWVPSGDLTMLTIARPTPLPAPTPEAGSSSL